MRYLELPLYTANRGTNAGSELGTDRANRFVEVVEQPELAVVFPDTPSGASVLILPGGGYRRVCVDKEGLDFARLMAGWGMTAAVLTYRQPLGVFADPPRPLQDARQALMLLQENADEWKLDPQKLVLMGFSAGGHLALTALREPGAGLVPRTLVLGYPVVSMHPPLVHEVSRDNLLGPGAPAVLLERFSAERGWGPKMTVPEAAFLLHSDDDASVPVGNSVALAEALKVAGTKVELLRHPTGGHGYGMGPAHGFEHAPDWVPRLRTWLVGQGLSR